MARYKARGLGLATVLALAIGCATLAFWQDRPMTVQAAQEGSTYTVERGDSLYSIAGKLGVSVADLASANGLSVSGPLYRGVELVIPASNSMSDAAQDVQAASDEASSARMQEGSTAEPAEEPEEADAEPTAGVTEEAGAAAEAQMAPAPSTAATYKVQAGDSLLTIAKMLNISRDALAAANGLDRNAILYRGQILTLPGTGTSPAVPAAAAPPPAAPEATEEAMEEAPPEATEEMVEEAATPEPTEEMIEEATAEATGEPTEEPTEEPAEESTEEMVEEATPEATEEMMEEEAATSEATAEGLEEATPEPAEEMTEEETTESEATESEATPEATEEAMGEETAEEETAEEEAADDGATDDGATAEPTEEATAEPTEEMGEEATPEGTEEMTEEPTATPTEEMMEEPTAEATEEMTEEPTEEPTEEATATPTEEMAEEANLLDTITEMGEFTVLLEALEVAGLSETLTTEGPFTLFAPTDEAFDALPAGTIDGLLASSPDDLSQILLYHILSGEVLSSDFVDGVTVITAQGGTVTLGVTDDGLTVNDALITTSDIETSNGVIHIIDAVLLPSGGMAAAPPGAAVTPQLEAASNDAASVIIVPAHIEDMVEAARDWPQPDDAIALYSPVANSGYHSPINITGLSKTFGGHVVINLTVPDGTVLAQRMTLGGELGDELNGETGDEDGYAFFQTSVRFYVNESTEATLNVHEIDMAEGTILYTVEAPLTLLPGQRFLDVNSPAVGARACDPVLISAYSNTFEANVVLSLYTPDGELLTQWPTMGGTMGFYRDFATPLPYPEDKTLNAATPILVSVTETDASGRLDTVDETRIPITLYPADSAMCS